MFGDNSKTICDSEWYFLSVIIYTNSNVSLFISWYAYLLKIIKAVREEPLKIDRILKFDSSTCPKSGCFWNGLHITGIKFWRAGTLGTITIGTHIINKDSTIFKLSSQSAVCEFEECQEKISNIKTKQCGWSVWSSYDQSVADFRCLS